MTPSTFAAIGLVVLGIGFAWYRFVYRAGNPGFWKAISEHPDVAYDWFVADTNSWVIVDPANPGARVPQPRSAFSGPFLVRVPKLGNRTIKVYGRYPEFEDSQQRFLGELAELRSKSC